MKVLKFGGSVIRNANDIKNIQKIIKQNINNNEENIIVVVSAFHKITDKLLEIFEILLRNDVYINNINYIIDFHTNLIDELQIEEDKKQSIFILLNELSEVVDNIKKKIQNSSKNIKKSYLLDNLLDKEKDLLLSFGERLSSRIIFSFLSQTDDISYINSQDLIKTDSNFGCANVDIIATKRIIRSVIDKIKSKIIICAGFIGSNSNGEITTLGRNGSDYSASLFADATNAKILELWKDIDCLYTADPKIVENVKSIKQISYQEMIELSSLGNKVIHIDAISPCLRKNIPILIKNCYNPSSIGTIICKEKYQNYYVNSIVKMDNVFILKINIYGENINITDFNIKLQHILYHFQDKIITISQNIKQKIVSIILTKEKSDYLINILTETFHKEIKENNILITIGKVKSMITIIGADFSNVVGVSGKIFNILQNNNININAIHDDFSSTRISFLCKKEESNKIVKLLHKELVEKKIN